jgi:hypothetical protein
MKTIFISADRLMEMEDVQYEARFVVRTYLTKARVVQITENDLIVDTLEKLKKSSELKQRTYELEGRTAHYAIYEEVTE